MPSSYQLRALNPQTDLPLFEQAYRWRDRQRSDRMPFEQFAADAPNQIVLGLFNGELQAAYLLSEVDGVWECHFTSRRDADKSMVLLGAQWVIDYFATNGLPLRAYVNCRNKPLQRFAEAAGLIPIGHKTFPCQASTDSGTLAREIEFIEYGR